MLLNCCKLHLIEPYYEWRLGFVVFSFARSDCLKMMRIIPGTTEQRTIVHPSCPSLHQSNKNVELVLPSKLGTCWNALSNAIATYCDSFKQHPSAKLHWSLMRSWLLTTSLAGHFPSSWVHCCCLNAWPCSPALVALTVQWDDRTTRLHGPPPRSD